MKGRYHVRFDMTVDGGWEVYDTQMEMTVFGSDSRREAENFAGELERDFEAHAHAE
jgi:hypothetical protein